MLRFVVLFATVLSVATSASIFSTNDDKYNLGARIVGGTVTDISKHAYLISMRYKPCDTCLYNHLCGGSIITSNIILTAAHCVVGISDPKQLHIVAGTNERNGHGVIIPVKKIVSHEDYRRNGSFENDIAILVLEIALELNDYNINVIKMTEKRPDHNEISQITGWGTTTEDGHPANLLLEAEVRIVSNDICEAKYGKESGLINKSMLCTGSAKGGKDTCQGDSGGPLLVKGLLAGVVSWGYGCARPDYPRVYASVSDLRPWIDEAIKANNS